jgi:Ca2+-binding EF-hand superfamily protein
VDLDRAMPRAKEFFNAADVNKNGELSMQELRELFKAASTQYPYFQEYARYLEEHEKDSEGRTETKANVLNKLFDDAVGRDDGALNFFGEFIPQRVETQRLKKNSEQISKQLKDVDVNQNNELDYQEFTELLKGIEGNLRGFPPTAQVTQQQGQYLARRLAEGQLTVDEDSHKQVTKAGKAFTYLHKGSLVFLGQGVAGMDAPLAGTFTGEPIGVAWKAFETMNQFSWKNRALVALDWMRTQVWGRDSSRLGR